VLFSCVALGLFLYSLNQKYLVNIPYKGGVLTEAVIGTPRFVNPVLAVTPADKDLSALIYAGLMKLGPDGMLVPNMAESVTVSEDGLTYSIALRSGLTFHDGIAVTSDDIIFTISRIQDPGLKSPLLASWEGVTVERVSDRELNLVLAKPYGPFLENLTVGILPRHIWEDASVDAFPFSQYNSEPIGSGPYEVARIIRSTSGIPESYELEPFAGAASGMPRISTLRVHFYSNEEAMALDWHNGRIDNIAGISPGGLALLGDTSATHQTLTAPLPRTFAVFFNQNEAPVFRDAAVRSALTQATDRTYIADTILAHSAIPITGPLPPRTLAEGAEVPSLTQETIDAARSTLREAGWKFDDTSGRWRKKIGDDEVEFAFTLATANNETLERTAEALKEQWERIGAVVTVEKYEQVDLTQTVIRPRKYDALLFGTIVGRETDFYPFWHSSQRNDPGLNIALYANIVTDEILLDTRALSDYKARTDKNNEFVIELEKDMPALFLYSPTFTYILPRRMHDVGIDGLAEPYERFSNIERWYSETESVWPFFK
jgi:peptide/nickel transport system substrate-binding protein